MVNLVNFYFSKATEEKYYSKFYEDILNYYRDISEEYNVYNIQDAINNFKDLIKPKNETSYNSLKLNSEFILLCFYLYQENYIIEDFPIFLETPSSLEKFAYEDIRTKIKNDEYKKTNLIIEKVPWNLRIIYIENMIIIKKELLDNNIELDNNVNKILEKISFSNVEFKNKTKEEQLVDIAGIIENLIKENDEYISINTEDTCDILTERKIIEYRNLLHSYRHHDEKAIENRKKHTDITKGFLVDFGIMVINYLIKSGNVRKELKESGYL